MRWFLRTAIGVSGVLLLLAASGCGGEQQAWDEAIRSDSLDAYEAFLAEHPDSLHAEDAKTRVGLLRVELEWERVQSADTLEAYRTFLANHGDSAFTESALERLTVLENAEWDGRSVEQRTIATLPNSFSEGTAIVSDNGSHYAYVAKVKGGQCVIHNGKRLPVYDRVSKPRFSPQSHRLFYWALDYSRRDEGVILLADGQETATGLDQEGSIWFSRDGERWAMVGGKQQRPITLIVDGEKIERHSDMSYPAFSRDGKHLAFLAPDALVVDGQPVREFGEPEADTSMELAATVIGPHMPPLHKIMYLSNGSLVYLTKETKGWTVFLDDERLASYPHNIWGGGSLRLMTFKGFDEAASILASSITVAENAPFVVWWERPQGRDKRWRVVRNAIPVDDVGSNEFWDSQQPVISANGTRWAYPAYVGDDAQQLFLVIDGEKHGPYSHIWGVGFSGNSDVVAYAASSGGDEAPWKYYIGGEALPGNYDTVWPIELSHDGRHYAWKARRGNSFIVAIDAKEEYVGERPLKGPIFLYEARGEEGTDELRERFDSDSASNPRVTWYVLAQETKELVRYLR